MTWRETSNSLTFFETFWIHGCGFGPVCAVVLRHSRRSVIDVIFNCDIMEVTSNCFFRSDLAWKYLSISIRKLRWRWWVVFQGRTNLCGEVQKINAVSNASDNPLGLVGTCNETFYVTVDVSVILRFQTGKKSILASDADDMSKLHVYEEE